MNTIPNSDLQQLLPSCCEIAKAAGDIILQYYQQDLAIEEKPDRTRVTEADKAADLYIMEALQQLKPSLPVISEESALTDFATRREWSKYWLVDPLDGTHQFIQGNDEFTVNIALIEAHRSVLGVVYAPVSKKLWYASIDSQPQVIAQNGHAEIIEARPYDADQLTVISGHSDKSQRYLDMLSLIKPAEHVHLGSSLKICLIAEGQADIYPRLGRTSEWDTAAAQCILEQAGGYLTDTSMQTLKYNTKESILNPEFFAFGASQYNWAKHLDQD